METLDSVLAAAECGDKQAKTQVERLKPIWASLSRRLAPEGQAFAKAIYAKLG